MRVKARITLRRQADVNTSGLYRSDARLRCFQGPNPPAYEKNDGYVDVSGQSSQRDTHTLNIHSNTHINSIPLSPLRAPNTRLERCRRTGHGVRSQ